MKVGKRRVAAMKIVMMRNWKVLSLCIRTSNESDL